MIPGVLLSPAIKAVERGYVPDSIIRWGIRRFHADRLKTESQQSQQGREEKLRRFIGNMNNSPVALVPEKANEQHYEVPTEFFKLVLGKRLKYSGCLWPPGTKTLDEAEGAALRKTCEHAELRDGMEILELGCGWGSLSLWMAEQYPESSITAVSNSSVQREFIESEAKQRNLVNVRVITADMNEFQADRAYDRIVSVEMFEHMRNYRELLKRIADWLKPEGKLFVHIFCHRQFVYVYETEGPDNWMGRYFFSGGMMPSDQLFTHFQEDLTLEQHWNWDGTHYQKTADAWLANLDRKRSEAMPVLAETYGAGEARKWFNRWRIFFMACAELFGYRNGQEWWVSHYLFKRR